MDALRLGIAPSPSVVASLLYFIQQHRIPRGKELCTPFSNTIIFAFLSLMKTPYLTIPYTNTSFARTNSGGEKECKFQCNYARDDTRNDIVMVVIFIVLFTTR